MKLNKRKAKVIFSALDEWEREDRISSEQAEKLSQSIEVAGFDWRLLAVYSFWIAISCFIISVGVLLADDYLLALLASIFDAPASVVCITTACIAALCYYAGIKRRLSHPSKTISNEAIFFFGVLMSAVSVGILGETTMFAQVDDASLLLLLTVIYAVLGVRLSSVLIWIFALFSFVAWVQLETTELSNFSDYFLGMSHPMRFTIVGAVIALMSLRCNRYTLTKPLKDSTQFIGLLFFLLGFWLLSIFGNYGDASEWAGVKQIELIHWAILSTSICAAILYVGIHFADSLCRSFGITFLLINLYTRFFEYVWDTAHKTIFFAILALSFWFIGTHAERLWQLGTKAETK
ncbi:hypothetical protein [Photobacterium sanguinicancri]|uniref:hypothetical protein n=1 Tax=Photobacterium sanguinicancri TaxID=875932 RepID=UPI003D131E78